MSLFITKNQRTIWELREKILKQERELEILRPIPGDMAKLFKQILDMKPKRAIGLFVLEQWNLLDSLSKDPLVGKPFREKIHDFFSTTPFNANEMHWAAENLMTLPGTKKHKIRRAWSCSDFVKHEHRTKFGAWLCGRWQKLKRIGID